jgi:threonylcarbamoyladenosine tRNA methylthiotransferase MtaB
VGDYGRKSGSNLLILLRSLVEVDGLERIRISSIEPNLVTEELLAFVGSNDVLCKHFHIPLQSGDDGILRAMRRRYSTGQYAALLQRIKELLPDCGIGVDVIAGFPGETEEQFQGTFDFISGLPASYLHVFTYSERPGTPAAGFGNPVEHGLRYRRSARLRSLGRMKRLAFAAENIGTVRLVLAESDVEDDIRYGFTENYMRVGIPADCAAGNTILRVEIVDIGADTCIGRVLDREALK